MSTGPKDPTPPAAEPQRANPRATAPLRSGHSGQALFTRLGAVRGVRSSAGLVLLAAVSVSSAMLLSPARLTPPIPDDESLGQLATATIKAPRDFDVLDPETTEQKRDEAARSVWPVYTFDAQAQDLLAQRIGSAFEQGRAAVAEWQKQNPAKAAHVSTAQETRSRAGATVAHRRTGPDETELLRFLGTRRDEFLKALQAVIEDEDYVELASAGFDPTVERSVLRLAGLASAGYAVQERELLAADRERGIAVRTLAPDGRTAGERQVRDIDRIRDLAQVQKDLERLAQDQLSELPLPLRHAVLQLVRRALRPNLAFDDTETRRRVQEKRAAVKEVLLQIKKGEKIVGDGEPITKTTLLIFHAIAAAGHEPGAEQIRFGGGLFTALICVTLFTFARRNVPRFRPRGRDVLLLAAVLVGQLCLTRAGLAGAEMLHDLARDQFGARDQRALLAGIAADAAVPFAAGSMLVRFLLFGEAALAFSAALAPLCGLLAGGMLQPAVLALVGGLVAADRAGHAGSRGALFRAGVWTAAANVLVVCAFSLFGGRFFTPESAAAIAGAAIGGALLTPLAVLAVAPLFELAFGVTTDIELLKLANLNHPVLKDLIVQAPGTYHHSIVIGALVEAAARTIGANPLLARVGAYYHDIGKGKNPLIFGENQKTENRHDQLTALMSAQLIRRHVGEGLELARQAKLPKPVRDFIAQHHGTRLVGYFYARAREEAERQGQPPPAEADFRYAGPRPQFRETALVMIAEIVVATSRNLTEATRASLRTLVDHAVASVLADGQLDECEITQLDLRRMGDAFVDTLLGLYHARPELPTASPGARPAPPLRVLGPDGDAALKLAGKS